MLKHKLDRNILQYRKEIMDNYGDEKVQLISEKHQFQLKIQICSVNWRE